MKHVLLFTLSIFLALAPLSSEAQSKKKKKKAAEAAALEKKKSAPEKASKFKPYDKLINKTAISDSGLFTTHKVNNKFYFEIPNSLLGKDMLLVSRIKQLPENFGGGYINAGTKTATRLIVWERFQDKILIKEKSSHAVANKSLAINASVKVNNYEPTLFSFDISSFSKDSSAVVIDVTKFYSTDVKAISGLTARARKSYKVRNLDASRSFINSVKSFPNNIEVVQDMTYNASEPPSFKSLESISIQMNQSMILLPEEPMQKRYADERVGWFSFSQIDYGSEALKADEKTYIRRWRLEPKDPEAYARGELVEPIKPIIYYLDPGTPENLRKYIKEGVELWQKPFEKAGFKNAIIAKYPPTKEEDPDFSPEDIRYSVIRYVASETRNAMGPSVSDPRSGEIIESDIIWYHNHLRSYRNRYLLETGAANPSARTLDTPAEDIGEMMKMVIAHEVGHALGLPHNMSASKAYSVEDYRSGEFTQKNGIAATIMDYARYNYIAQPGDKNIRFIRQIGPYDEYAINWGYRYIPEAKTSEDEIAILDKWILEKANDLRYRFGKQSSRFDPNSQTEDIGDDAIKASNYALKNLKIVVKYLPEWTSDKTNNYKDLEELYGELLGCWNRYSGHVATNVGGVYEHLVNPNQEKTAYEAVPKSLQKASVNWLHKNVFETPNWLIDKSIITNIDYAGYTSTLGKYQNRFLSGLLSFDKLGRLIDHEAINAENYSALEMLIDVRKGLFTEANYTKNVDVYRRNLQRAYVDRMAYLMTDEGSPRTTEKVNVTQSDIRPIIRGELNVLQRNLKNASVRGVNTITKYHYKDLVERIEMILNPK
ncbi:zinc-dependent metalloprotease [Neotamlana laminarinivorans]|uniref:Zinc-dependent metalloprotease n=1 Tax=Neotamlana laminarinivorans TaxID=2883124 RepID=A0A9X1HY29_9FLAO|nr:zinc-dependent metalloprotease [Tamlana laminarinivorans]MCB4797691.1 zinc-dependent metalloprotease [Tamlana laminarinivorans]